jgi:hypothetical protein
MSYNRLVGSVSIIVFEQIAVIIIIIIIIVIIIIIIIIIIMVKQRLGTVRLTSEASGGLYRLPQKQHAQCQM